MTVESQAAYFFSLRAVHIWLYIFLSPDLTHQYLYFLKLAPPWSIPLKDSIPKCFSVPGNLALIALLSQMCTLKSFFASHPRLRVSNFVNPQSYRPWCCSLLLRFSQVFKVSFIPCFICKLFILGLVLHVALTWDTSCHADNLHLFPSIAIKNPDFLNLTLILYGGRS